MEKPDLDGGLRVADPEKVKEFKDRIARLEERVERERRRRKAAEKIAEGSARDLHARLHQLRELTNSLEKQVRERTRALEGRLTQQEALRELSLAALREGSLGDLVDELCQRTAKVLDVSHSDVFQLVPGDDKLVLRAGSGWPQEKIDHATLDATEGSQSGYTVKHWEATIVEDYREDERFRPEAEFEEAGIQSGITVVVPGPVEPWGIFGVHSTQPRAFDAHDVTFVQTMSRVLSQSIQRERVQRELEFEKERFKSIVQTVEEYAIFSCDPDGHVQTWNEGAERIKGYSADDIIGEHFRILYTEEDRQAGVPERNLKIAAQEGSFEDEGWRRRKDGSRFWAGVTLTAIYDDEGNVKGFSKVTRDMTDRKEYERRLEASNRRLEQFAYAASHDLQEPLRMVTSYLDLLEDQYGDQLGDDAREMVSHAADGAQRGTRMVESLLEYARVSSEGKPLEPTDAGAMLEDALSDLSLRIEETDARVTSAKLPLVHADPDQLAQVFRNLVSNALEHSGDEPPRIQVDAEPMDDRWRFSVHDNGVGIPQEKTDEIFQIFERSHAGSGEGTGIGLAICRQIVDRHGGDIWVDSEPGEGSTFHFTMPAAP